MLSYQDDLARDGARLFRARGNNIYVVIVLGTLVAYLHRAPGPFADASANRAWFWASLAVALAGALWRVYVSGHAAFGTSGRRKRDAEAEELNTTGAYSLVRNPLYVGRIVNFTGLAMLTGSATYGAVVFLVSILVYERISAYEQAFLVSKFGDAFARWAAAVPALLPRLHGYVRPKYPFWWRRMFWREFKKFFQLSLALFLYDLARRGFDPAALPADLTWYYAFAGMCVARVLFAVAKQAGAFRDLK